MTRVCWIAAGLSINITGIEQFTLSLARELARRKILEPESLTVYANPDATWTSRLAEAGADIQAASRSRWVRPQAAPKGTSLVHNLGGGRFPRRNLQQLDQSHYVFSVYDWGPFQDRTMPLRARIAWATAIVRGSRQADTVHYLNPSLALTRPCFVPRPRHIVIASSSSSAVPGPFWRLQSQEDPPYALFVGSAVARKRIDQIVLAAALLRMHVVLAGDGTEAYNDLPYVTALGRVTDAELDQLYSRSSALLLLSSYEGFGIPILEAAARGVRSVVSKEVFVTLPDPLREFAFVCDPTLPDTMAVAIQRAAASRGLSEYDPTSVLEPLLATYATILGR